MINLEKMAEKYRDAGYSERNADARVCQDIVLKAISRSNLGRNVTIEDQWGRCFPALLLSPLIHESDIFIRFYIYFTEKPGML